MDGATIVAMRMLLALALFAGCASTQALETAQRHVAACEYQRDVEAAAGDQQRAARTDADCGAWRAQVAIEQGRVERADERRAAVGAAMSGMGAAHTAAAEATPSPMHCEGRRSYANPDRIDIDCR